MALAPPTPEAPRPIVRLDVPLCADCQRRAAARSPEERTAKLQGHLISAVLGLGAVVAVLALRLVDLSADPLITGFLLALLGVLGYALPAIVLVGRAGRMPLPDDAVYVRTTLLIPANGEGSATAFEWRNAEFAALFRSANASSSVGGVHEVLSPV